MAGIRLTALLVIAGRIADAQCFEKYECIFHHVVGGTEYSWDLHQLCRPPGAEYSFSNATESPNIVTSFNICGNTSAVCSPGYPLYDSHGVAVQFIYDVQNPAPLCDPEVPACTDYDLGVSTCCTQNCSVLVSPSCLGFPRVR
jgi:hypothetical protein